MEENGLRNMYNGGGGGGGKIDSEIYIMEEEDEGKYIKNVYSGGGGVGRLFPIF